MSDKLLPCPFCGGAPEISTPYRKVAICTTCAARGPIGDNPAEGWNSRAQPAPADHVVGTEERGIGIGMAIAAGIIMRVWGQEVYAHEILTTAGFTTLDELKASGVDQFDINALMPIFAATATEGSGE